MKNTEKEINSSLIEETRIFLASSINEFENERMEISDFIRKLNDALIKEGRYLKLVICEDITNAIAIKGKQQEYNEEIRSCNHFYTLIGESIGYWTNMEIGVASENKEPVIHAFIKNTGKAGSMAAELESQGFHAYQEQGQTDSQYQIFDHIDKVKLEILKTFFTNPDKLEFIENKIYLTADDNRRKTEETRHGKVYLLDLDKVPMSSEEAKHYLSITTNKNKKRKRSNNGNDIKMITVILASSQDTDSILLSDHIRDLNDQYYHRGYYFLLLMDDKIMGPEYLEEKIKNSNCFYIIMGNNVREDMIAEFDQALETFREKLDPKIYVYFSSKADQASEKVRNFKSRFEGNDPEISHYYSSYDNIDTVKLNFIQEFHSRYLKEILEIKEGSIYANGKEILNVTNIPIFAGNKEHQKILEELKQLRKILDDLKKRYEKPIKEKEEELDILKKSFDQKRLGPEKQIEEKEKELQKKEEELDVLKKSYDQERLGPEKQIEEKEKELQKMENNILDVFSSIMDLNGKGEIITEAYKEASRYLDEGKYEEALKALSPEHRKKDINRAKKLRFQGNRNLAAYINEDRMRIKIMESQGIDEEKFKKIKKSYEDCFALVREEMSETDVVYEYACFLYLENRRQESLKYAEWLNTYYDLKKAGTDKEKRGLLYILLGNLYTDDGRYQDAETAYNKAIKVYKPLAEKYDGYQPYLAECLINLGDLYKIINRYKKAEEIYKQADEIYEGLARKDPANYMADRARTSLGMGLLYWDTDRYDEAKQKLESAQKTYKELVSTGKSEYRSDLAASHVSLSDLFKDTDKYEDAKTQIDEAIKIYEELAEENAYAYKSLLADAYSSLGNLYKNQNEYKKAEEIYRKALLFFQQLEQFDPLAFNADLARSHNNLGILYTDIHDHDNAKKELEFVLDKATNEGMLASSHNATGVLYEEIGDFETAGYHYQEAYKIYHKLAKKSPETYKKYLAGSYNSLGRFYTQMGKYPKAESFFDKAIAIRKELPQGNSLGYLASSYNDIANLYVNFNRFTEARESYQKAISCYSALNKHSHAYDSHLARILHNLAILDTYEGSYDWAKASYQEAESLYQKLYRKNPSVFIDEMAALYKDMAVLYFDINNDDEALKHNKKAIRLYKKLQNSDAYLNDLADVCNNLFLFYLNQGETKKAERFYNKELKDFIDDSRPLYTETRMAILKNLAFLKTFQGNLKGAYETGQEILTTLEDLNIATYRDDIASVYQDLAVICHDLKSDIEMKEYIEKAIDICKDLTRKDPDIYKEKLAETYELAASLYEDCDSKLFAQYQKKAKKTKESITK